jgi:DNA-binding NarL/FixJ family response regulator
MDIETCFIVDDIEDTLKWLSESVNSTFPEISITTATTFKLAEQIVSKQSFDMALIDLSLPDGSGIDIIRDIKRKYPDTMIIVVTIHDDDKHIFSALKAGANGYLLKDTSVEEFIQKLKGILTGVPLLSPAIALKLIDYFAEKDQEDVRLTARESEVLMFIAKGMSSRQVAELLNISANTVSSYVKTIYRKLGISSRAEASIEALRRGLM